MTVQFFRGDLPADAHYGAAVAIDTETLGLNPYRDRLCLVQLSGGDGNADIVQIAPGQTAAPRLTALLADRSVVRSSTMRFDIAVLFHAFGRRWRNRCSAPRSPPLDAHLYRSAWLKGSRQGSSRRRHLKQQQSSDWAAETLTEAQLAYAAGGVTYLHQLRESSRHGSIARSGAISPRRVSASCPPAPGSILPAGARTTFSPTSVLHGGLPAGVRVSTIGT